MKITRKAIKVAATQTLDLARKSGKKAAQRLRIAADEALMEAGRAAKRRQRKRVMKVALKRAGQAILVAGTTAATVMAVRAARASKQTRTDKTAK